MSFNLRKRLLGVSPTAHNPRRPIQKGLCDSMSATANFRKRLLNVCLTAHGGKELE